MRLFKNTNFLLLFIGRVITNIGDSIYAVAAMWLVYKLGGSTFHTGLAGFLTVLPQTLQFLVGPLVDRWNIRKTLAFSQIAQAILILLIPIADSMNRLSISLILIIMPITSLIAQFAYPAQTVALPRIIEKEQLIKGNTLFSFAYQGIDMIFNAVSGILVTFFGAVLLYFIDSITFLVAALLFFLIKFPRSDSNHHKHTEDKSIVFITKQYANELIVGFRYVFNTIIVKMFIGSVIINFTLGCMYAILPDYADNLGGAEVYGFLLTSLSIGYLVGALLASFLGEVPIGKLSIISFLLGSLCWVSSFYTTSVIFSIILFGVAFVPIGSLNVVLGSAGQRFIPENLLARVFTVITSISTSAMPLGSLVGGLIASLYGSENVFLICGGAIALISIVWFMIPELRNFPAINKAKPEKYGFTRDISV